MESWIGSPDIILVWPSNQPPPEPTAVQGYGIHHLQPTQDALWIDIHRLAVPSFGESDLKGWLKRYRRLALPDGILVAMVEVDNKPVATAGSIADSKNGMFPGGGQLAWLAVVPEHRRRGQADRWSKICDRIDHSFEPEVWPTLDT
ncbi:MAG: GNAT family N-acetyltransferase [Planctomycetota bacterium]|jgi:hypothetical protein